MSRFSADDVERLANLAQLRIAPADRDSVAADLGQILEYVDCLGAVPTEGVPETAHVVEGIGDMRADDPVPSLSIDDALANAPDGDPAAGLFRVPRVIGA